MLFRSDENNSERQLSLIVNLIKTLNSSDGTNLTYIHINYKKKEGLNLLSNIYSNITIVSHSKALEFVKKSISDSREDKPDELSKENEKEVVDKINISNPIYDLERDRDNNEDEKEENKKKSSLIKHNNPLYEDFLEDKLKRDNELKRVVKKLNLYATPTNKSTVKDIIFILRREEEKYDNQVYIDKIISFTDKQWNRLLTIPNLFKEIIKYEISLRLLSLMSSLTLYENIKLHYFNVLKYSDALTINSLFLNDSNLSDPEIDILIGVLNRSVNLFTLDISNIISRQDAFLANDYDAKVTKVLDHVSGSNSLVNLNVSRLGITYSYQIDSIIKILSKGTLTTLDISKNFTNFLTREPLIRSLSKNTSLSHLNLSGNMINLNLIELISNTLKVNTSLTYLDLSDCNLSSDNIGNKGVKYLSDILEVNNTLITLKLSNININNNGFKNLEKALKVNKGLKILDISHNYIDVYGLDTLSDLLKHNRTLTSLDLFNNTIKGQNFYPEIIRDFEEALKLNSTIQTIDLSTYNAMLYGEYVVKLNQRINELRVLKSKGLKHAFLMGTKKKKNAVVSSAQKSSSQLQSPSSITTFSNDSIYDPNLMREIFGYLDTAIPFELISRRL